jgi:TPR repeat protein
MENIEREWSTELYAEQLSLALRMMDIAPEKTLKTLVDLSESGSVLSMVYIGDMFANGRGIKKDVYAGIDWYKKSMLQGSIEGSFRLSFELSYLERHHEAIEVLESIAKIGFSPAAYVLGSLYFEGHFVKKDLDKAMYYWKIAEDNGHLHAKRNISIQLRSGKFGIFGIVKGYLKLLSVLPKLVFVLTKEPDSERVRGWSNI